MLSVPETGQALGCDPERVREWIELGLLPALSISDEERPIREHLRIPLFGVVAVLLEAGRDAPRDWESVLPGLPHAVRWYRAGLQGHPDLGRVVGLVRKGGVAGRPRGKARIRAARRGRA